jgi:hypothetical protein
MQLCRTASCKCRLVETLITVEEPVNPCYLHHRVLEHDGGSMKNGWTALHGVGLVVGRRAELPVVTLTLARGT